MNFPGLDPIWSGAHHVARSVGLIRPWSLEEARAQLAEGEKILVVASTALGDSLLTTPLVETLSHYLGRERVSLLAKAPFADLYRDDPRLHRVFTVRGKYRWDNLRAELRADPHRIALLANVTEPDLVPCLWHGGVRAFLRHRARSIRYPAWMADQSMLRQPGDPDYGSGHAIENNLAMAEALGFAPSTRRLNLPQFVSGADRRWNAILIHPGASRPNKRWPVENWARLADALKEKSGLNIGFTGDRGERGLVDQVMAQMKTPATNTAGDATLPALAQVQRGAVAFLSGDTGPYHLAVAVGCPTVTLFAPTDRGSSVEACGPHRADPALHRAIQTLNFGDSIASLRLEHVLAEAVGVVEKSLARQGLS